MKTSANAFLWQWDALKNGSLEVSEISLSSHKKVWWLCGLGHTWSASLANRTNGRGCPFCSGRKVLSGYNDLLTTHPAIAAEWDYEKNLNRPSELSKGSSQKVWWLCPAKHSYYSSPNNRQGGKGCPFCSGRKVLSGYNDLLTTHPAIAHQMHPTKNHIYSTEITFGSDKKVWWLCDEGHEWEAIVSSRTSKKGRGCPVCSGKTLVVQVNDLATSHPSVAQEWNVSKNKSLHITDVTAGSNKKVWWLCDEGHEWEAYIYNRTSAVSTNCPVCSGKKTLAGFNDLATRFPVLAMEWSNINSLKSNEVTPGSTFMAAWVCKKGHKWNAAVYSRTGSGKTGCPTCNNNSFTSKPEIEIKNFIETLGVTVFSGNRTLLKKNRELDLYIPDLNIGIEFNGLYWHSDWFGTPQVSQYRHQLKWLAAKEVGVQLIQVWEDDWKDKSDIIMKNIAKALQSKNLNTNSTTSIKYIQASDAKIFMQNNHIEKFTSGDFYLQAQDSNTGKTVAVLSLKQNLDSSMTIKQYAELKQYDEFGKLLSKVKNMYTPTHINVFSDNTNLDHLKYEKYGFVVNSQIPPSFKIVMKGKRFDYEKISSFDIEKNPKIWDAGKTEYIMRLNYRSSFSEM